MKQVLLDPFRAEEIEAREATKPPCTSHSRQDSPGVVPQSRRGGLPEPAVHPGMSLSRLIHPNCSPRVHGWLLPSPLE